MGSAQKDKIPIVDLQNLFQISFDGHEKNIQEMANSFGQALHDYGFAYLVNHGIPQQMIDDAFEVSLKFFSLPPEVKEKYLKVDHHKSFHGYARPGMEFLNAQSTLELRETFDLFQTERYYPEEIEEFQEKLENLENACRTFDLKLLKLLAITLKIDDVDFFCKRSQSLKDMRIPSHSNYRTLYYPPIPADIEITPGTLRCATHSDWGIMTLLFQDAIGGLDIQKKNGDWVQVDPLPGSIVVNTGDLLEAWTGKYFIAGPHRVLVPELETKRRTHRQSIAFFLQPDDDVMVTPLREGIFKNQNFDFESIDSKAYFVNKANLAYGKY